MKKCSKCKLEKEFIEFGVRLRNIDNLDDTCKQCRKEYYENNKNERLKYQKQYDFENLSKISNNKKLRRQKDELFKMKDNISSLIRKSLKGYKNKTKSEDILKCSIIEFKIYIELMFKENMSWSNHGEWELDHIIPVCSAKTKEELFMLNHYTNFQPLWKNENRSKSGKL